jgi:NAD(P)H-dependent FMN reductase
LTTSILIVPGSLRDAAVTTQIAALALAATAAGVTATPAGALGLMPLFNEDIDTDVPPGAVAPLLGKPAAVLVAGYQAGEAESHLDHVLEKAGARVIKAAGRVVSVRSLQGRAPGDVPAVREAVAGALAALVGAVT